MLKKAVISFLLVFNCIYADELASCYSSTEQKFGIMIDSGEEDQDWGRILYPGFGGYEILLEASEARAWINIKYGEVVSDLVMQVHVKAEGFFPAKTNDIIEWRGLKSKRGFEPYAIIYRVTVADEEGKDSNKLLVVSLNKGESEVLGAFSGKDENKKARELADTVKPNAEGNKQ